MVPDDSKVEARERRADDALDHALAQLGRADLEPFAARALHVEAERRLRTGRTRGPLERFEARVLIGLSAAQLLWALLRVYELAGS
jgi:hypothetical protein